MGRLPHLLVLSALIAAAVAMTVAPGSAHKPITSPFTYNEDVFPVLRDRCARCHMPDGVAPMSLLTHEDTVPWGESIRVELLAGHMPPWSVDSAPGRFRNVPALTAREMNVLLTWATGGTPIGDAAKAPAPVTTGAAWPLGEPDLTLPFPQEFTLTEDVQERTVEFIVPTGTTSPRWLRAVDLRPGTPAIVRAATVEITDASTAEPVLSLWLPGDDPMPTGEGAAFALPSGASLKVRVHYRKTWQYERKEMRDKSAVGLYFAEPASSPVRAVRLAPDATTSTIEGGRLVFRNTLGDDMRAVAVYPDQSLVNVDVTVTAVGTDGSRRTLIDFRPRAGWTRRFWFREPIVLSRGTVMETTVTVDDEPLNVPLTTGASAPRLDPSTIRLTLNVVAGTP